MKTVIASIEKGKDRFEIVVYADKAIEIRKGKSDNVRDALVFDEIFTDARKGNEASREALQKAFGTTDVEKIALEIIKNGHLPLTKEYLDKLRKEKLNEIIDIICKNAIDARTKMPIPPERIKNALEKIHYNIDPFKDASKQVEEIVKELVKVIPIKFEKVTIQFLIPPSYSSKVYGALSKYTIVKQEWLNDGSLRVILEVPGGMKNDVISKISSLCNGNIEVKEL